MQDKFYDIPSYTPYQINIKGDVRNGNTLEMVESIRNADNRVCYTLYKGESNQTLVGRYRLLMLTFSPRDDVSKLIVNHLDGIKDNDELSNLEWGTYRDNIEHAGLMGLTSKCIPMQTRNIDTKEVTCYPSAIACSRVLGTSKEFVLWRLKKGEHRVYPERLQYRKGHSDSPWVEPSKLDIEYIRSGNVTPLVAKNVITGVIQFYETLTEFAALHEIKKSTAAQWVSAENQPVFPGFIQVKKAVDVSEWRVVEDPYLELEKSTNKRCVVVIRSRGKPLLFTSGVDCAKAMGIKTTLLDYRLKSNGEKIFNDGNRYCYYSVFKSMVRMPSNRHVNLPELLEHPKSAITTAWPAMAGAMV